MRQAARDKEISALANYWSIQKKIYALKSEMQHRINKALGDTAAEAALKLKEAAEKANTGWMNMGNTIRTISTQIAVLKESIAAGEISGMIPISEMMTLNDQVKLVKRQLFIQKLPFLCALPSIF